jgi:hypothetical protein
MVIALDELGAHAGLKRLRIAEFFWVGAVRRRSTGGLTARETSPPPAPGKIKVCYRDIALDARAVGSGLGRCLLIEFGGAAIARSRLVADCRSAGSR